MDRFRLIEEVRKRPILWNSVLKNRSVKVTAESWDQVAESLGNNVTVDDCKSIWANLRKTYRNFYYDPKNRMRNRIEMEKRYGNYDPKKNYCKWVYYEHMHFLKEVFRQQDANLLDNENSFAYSEKSLDNDDYDEEEPLNSSKRINRSQNLASSSTKRYGKQYTRFRNRQNEAESYSTDDEEESRKPTKSPRPIHKNSEETNFGKKKSFENQNSAKEAVNVSMSEKDYNKIHSRNMLKDIKDSDHYFLLSFSEHLKSLSQLQNLNFRANIAELILSILTTSLSDDKLKTQEIMAQAETLVNVDDPDMNFLISFCPYMKLMTRLQNLQIRSKISALMLNMLSTCENSSNK